MGDSHEKAMPEYLDPAPNQQLDAQLAQDTLVTIAHGPLAGVTCCVVSIRNNGRAVVGVGAGVYLDIPLESLDSTFPND